MKVAARCILALAALLLTAAGAPAPDWVWPDGIAPPPIPADNPMSDAKVALGRRLFHDADLSVNGTMSCATCHEPRSSFTVGNRAHPGVHGEPGLRNAPSLLNVAWISPLTWGDPGLTTLEAQAMVPITGDDPVEMGMKGQEQELGRRLSANGCYRKLFRKAFPETKGRIDLASVTKALSAFQRTIFSHDSAWDHAALSAKAAQGEALFRGSAGCAACHSGPEFTDRQFHRLPGTSASESDTGLARRTGRAEDAGKFRTPSLRNFALTPPYLHDGSADTLDAVLARHDAKLSPPEHAQIAAFLDALTDRAITTDQRFTLPGPTCDMGS